MKVVFFGFIFMFIMVRLVFIFCLIFTSNYAVAAHQLFKPHFIRRLSTRIIENSPSVAIMGHHLCNMNEPHSRIDDREPLDIRWKPLRASSTFVMNFDEDLLSEKPVPAYQVTNKYCIRYEKGQKPQIIQLLPFGDEQRVQKDFKWFKENKYNNEYLIRMKWAPIRRYLYQLDSANLAEIYDTNFWDKDIKSNEDQAHTQLRGARFIDDITQLKTVSFFDNEDQLRFASLPRPIIPNIPFIKEPKDILKIAKFHKDFCNYMEYHFCLTQESIPLELQTFIGAFKTEPSRLLYLARPDSGYHITTRINRLKAYSLLRENRDDLLFNLDCKDAPFNYDEIKGLWKIYFKKQSKDWFKENEDLFRACFKFAEMIWKQPLPELLYPLVPKKPVELYRQQNHDYTMWSVGTVRSYEEEEEFKEDLVEIDPDFEYVREENRKEVPSQNELG